jgi:uncharacterized LabA/DUF88 family protein
VSKNVAVFVDVANIFYAAKAAGVDIDYVTLLKSATAGRDLVRAYAYTGLDPENENQRNFHTFLSRHGFKVVSKDIRKYGDGKVKANLDIELVVDMMKTARNLDIAIVVSGDGDFAPAIRAVQEMGVRVEVVSFRGNTSSDLIDVADLFTDITALARVEKGSSRSGRRVAGDEQDLSMTEVPDKQTEGTTTRGRGRGRTRTRGEPAPATTTRSRTRHPAAADGELAAAALVALPGEKLSKAATEPEGAADEEALEPTGEASAEDAERDGELGPRRRRRRGGRGRGRGRGRGEVGELGELESAEVFVDEEPVGAPRPPASTAFGSVWDSQLGVPAARPEVAPLSEDEDLDEPEIPEYLIAERRRERSGAGRGGGGGRFGGGRGARGAYAAAIERERYGRGSSGGINRYPDVGDRDRGRDRGGRGGRDTGFGRPPRQDRPDRAGRPSGSAEPWSEVPPELEAMLRAQLQSRPRERPETTEEASRGRPVEASAEVEATAAPDKAPSRARTGTRSRRTPAAATAAAGEAAAPPDEAATPKPTRRRTTSTAAGGSAAPKRPTRRRATAASAEGTADASTTDEPAVAPKRRTTRRKTADTPEASTE